jgi:antitoxin component YwqK of YwqJK toxin-antitoxin module
MKKMEKNWKNDKQDGISKSYHENGQLWTEGNWKNGKLKWNIQSLS